MITKYILVSILILFLLVSCVGAAEKTVSLKSSGLSETTKTSVNIANDGVTYTAKDSGISIKTATKVDGVLLSETPVTNAKGEVTVTSKDDTVSSKYTYFDNGTIKETITLLEDKQLSFPVTVPKGYRLIPWYNGQFKIVEESMEDTMTGLVAEKPYGIDNAGIYVDMNYIQSGNTLTLNYSRINIAYPLTIDPTWTSASGCWTNTSGSNYIVKWNSTGTSTWTVPSHVHSVQYLVVGGGGAGGSYTGGGGGAGGIQESNISVTPASVLTVTVGAGGSGSSVTSGGNSVFSSVTAYGGGNGGGGADASNGGSGGGSNTDVIYTGSQGGNGGADPGTTALCSIYNSCGPGGGGGGGGNGANGTSSGSPTPSYGGNGGSGYISSITTESLTYSTGGDGGDGGTGLDGNKAAATASTGNGGNGADKPDSSIWYGGNGGSGVVIINYIITYIPPVASFTSNVTSLYVNKPVQFIDTSTNTPTSWYWTLGDGNTSTSQNPLHTYTTTGIYTVTLNATNEDGSNTSTRTNYITVNTLKPNFTANVTSVDVNKPILFTDSSLGSPTTWSWTFGDGNTSSVQNPVKIYYGTGTYTVALTITSGGYGSNTSTRTNYITVTGGIPYAEFSANITTGVSPLNVAFTDTTNSSATSWNWTFGDGVGGGSNYSNSQNPTHVFTGVGYYNVTLNASSTSGFNITSKYHYINVTASLVNNMSYMNITPSPYKLYVLTNGTVQLNARNITGKYIYVMVAFNKSEVNIMSATNNFSVYPGLSITPIYDNTVFGYVWMNISNSSGGNVIIGDTLTPVADMKFRGMSYTNGSAPLPIHFATINLVTNETEGVNTTVPGILSTADSYFTFNVKLYNTATNTIINTVAMINAAGSNVTPTTAQTSTGSYVFKANFSNVTFNVSCDGFYTLNQTVLIQNENDVILRLTPLSGPGQNTWYSPHQVRFTTISQEYGTILVGSTINVTPITSSFPQGGSADYLVNVYGINPAAANDMMNGTLIMSGVTGNDGGVTFTMLSSIGYNVNIKNDTLGINHNIKIYPIENDYNILINMITTDTTMQDMNDTILTYTVPNASYGTFGLTYKDRMGLTTNVNFSVWCIDNNTMMYSTDLTGMGSNTVYANYTIPVVNGAQYIWKYNATRSI